MVSGRASDPSALVVDADNTLWDTNQVFEDARREMLSVLLKAGDEDETSSENRAGPDVLRELAQRLSLVTGTNDLNLLARATGLFLLGAGPGPNTTRVEWAARQAQAGAVPDKHGAGEALIQSAAEAFRTALRTVPPLLAGAEDLLRSVQEWKAMRPGRRQSVLFSEGDPDRLGTAFDAYGIGSGRHFDDIVLREKTESAFSDVRGRIETTLVGQSVSAPELDIVVIGDSLKRDIRPANAVGCTTVYCPGDFKGHETPDTPAEAPDHTVSSLTDALDLLRL